MNYRVRGSVRISEQLFIITQDSSKVCSCGFWEQFTALTFLFSFKFKDTILGRVLSLPVSSLRIPSVANRVNEKLPRLMELTTACRCLLAGYPRPTAFTHHNLLYAILCHSESCCSCYLMNAHGNDALSRRPTCTEHGEAVCSEMTSYHSRGHSQCTVQGPWTMAFCFNHWLKVTMNKRLHLSEP